MAVHRLTHFTRAFAVQHPRASIAGAMVAVALIALDLAVIRTALTSTNRALYYSAFQRTLMGLATQFALVRSAFVRSQRRLFWLGFATSGSVTVMILVVTPSSVFDVKGAYYGWVNDHLYWIETLMTGHLFGHRNLRTTLIPMLAFFVPQLVTSVAGGTLAMVGGGMLTNRLRELASRIGGARPRLDPPYKSITRSGPGA